MSPATANDGTGLFDGLQWGWRRRLPVILQTEAAECGLASLAMIARYHGHDVDLPSLRRRHSTSLKGANLARVMELAATLGFETRPLRLELEELAELKTPCILHWDLNHFVVLKQANARGTVVHDPARGVRKLSNAELSKHFTGVALELRPGADFKPVKARESISLRALTGKVKGLPGALIQIFVLALALEVFALAGPFYLQWILDQVLVSADKNLLTLLGIGFIAVTLLQILISAVRSWVVMWFGTMLNLQWANNLFSHMLRLPLDWYGKRHVGDIISRFGSLGTIQSTITTQFIGSILDGLMSSVTLIVLFLYSVPLTLLVLGLFAVYLILRLAFFRPLYRRTEEQIVYGARQQTEMLETIRGALPIKLGNKEAERAAHYANTMVETSNRGIATQQLSILFGSLNSALFGIGNVVLVWIAATLVLDGRFTAGMLIAYTAYASQFTSRAGSLVDYAMQLRMLKLHAERVSDIALAAPETTVEPVWIGEALRPTLEVRNVSFRYAEGEHWILKNCSLTVSAGESVAMIGASGCGKTTLAKIILGLLRPQEGEVLYGGVDIRKLGLARYRSQIGAVMQDDQLFAGSIADNISFFDQTATSLRIEAAAHQAAVHEDIAAMPMGYESLVGDMGSALSGGQKQRVVLARALYRKPALLVLDEATSHLDLECERLVNAAVNHLAITRLVIAHRPETIASAQRVLEMDNGAVQPIPSRPREVQVAG
jgi:ATP-binding cassette subfamily B protein RaxB